MQRRLVLLGVALISVAFMLPLFPLLVPFLLVVGGFTSLIIGMNVMRTSRAVITAVLSSCAVLAALAIPVVRKTSFDSFVVSSSIESRVSRAREAAELVQSSKTTRRWATCSFSVDTPVHVKVDTLDVWLRAGEAPSSKAPPQIQQSFFRVGELFSRALFGTLPTLSRLPEHERLVVGHRRGDELLLRVVDLANNRVECEGRAVVETDVAAAVLRPVCRRLDAEACATYDGPFEPITRRVVGDVLSAHVDDMMMCLEVVRETHEAVDGSVVFSFEVDEKGKSGRVTASDFPSPEAADCIATEIMEAQFPAKPGRAPVKIDFPFTMPSVAAE